MSQEFKDHMKAGEEYTCDKCQEKKLNSNEYDQYIRFQYHYCAPCWNYIHLKKGNEDSREIWGNCNRVKGRPKPMAV